MSNDREDIGGACIECGRQVENPNHNICDFCWEEIVETMSLTKKKIDEEKNRDKKN